MQGRNRRASPASPPQGWSQRRGAPRTRLHRVPSSERQEPDDHAHAPPDPTGLSVELRGLQRLTLALAPAEGQTWRHGRARGGGAG
jgi:hypothetical protein